MLAACACAAPAGAQTAAPDAPAAAPAAAPGGFGYGDAAGGLTMRTTALLHRTVRVSGTLDGARDGEGVVVQRLARGGRWQTVARARADRDGAFTARFRPNRTGVQSLRAVEASHADAAATAAAAQATGRLTVYRPAVATWFGPGFFGKKTACGQTLTPTTLGVAHRSLPCGTLVEVYNHGATITVPVIDRGPFRKGTTWDLTQAAAQAIGFTETGRVGALVVPAAS